MQTNDNRKRITKKFAILVVLPPQFNRREIHVPDGPLIDEKSDYRWHNLTISKKLGKIFVERILGVNTC